MLITENVSNKIKVSIITTVVLYRTDEIDFSYNFNQKTIFYLCKQQLRINSTYLSTN